MHLWPVWGGSQGQEMLVDMNEHCLIILHTLVLFHVYICIHVCDDLGESLIHHDIVNLEHFQSQVSPRWHGHCLTNPNIVR